MSKLCEACGEGFAEAVECPGCRQDIFDQHERDLAGVMAERDRLEARLANANERIWNEAIEAAIVELIATPARLKTCNNVPDYFVERGDAIDALRRKLRGTEAL